LIRPAGRFRRTGPCRGIVAGKWPNIPTFAIRDHDALIPVVGYLLVLGSALLLLERSRWSLEGLAAALVTLLLAALRNAWDMTLWIVIRVPVTQVEEMQRVAGASQHNE